MSDLQKYIKRRKARDPEFAKNFDSGYEQFKIGVMLKQASKTGGRIHTGRTGCSPAHQKDCNLSDRESR